MTDALDRICAYAERQLEGTGLTFAVVAWLTGRADDPKAVALSSPPSSQVEAASALATVLGQVAPAQTPDQSTETILMALATVWQTDARLDELDRDEMWDACRALRPEMTREQFEADWTEFLRLKAMKGKQ